MLRASTSLINVARFRTVVFTVRMNVAIRGRREWDNLENYGEGSMTFKWESPRNHLEKMRQIVDFHRAGARCCDLLNVSQAEHDNTVRNQRPYYYFNERLVRIE